MDIEAKNRTSAGKMRTFNKVDFLVSVGFLNARYDLDSRKFESSFYIRSKCYLNTLLKTSFAFKIFVSTIYSREDPIQL